MLGRDRWLILETLDLAEAYKRVTSIMSMCFNEFQRIAARYEKPDGMVLVRRKRQARFAVRVRSRIDFACQSRTDEMNKPGGRLHTVNFIGALLMYCCHWCAWRLWRKKTALFVFETSNDIRQIPRIEFGCGCFVSIVMLVYERLSPSRYFPVEFRACEWSTSHATSYSNIQSTANKSCQNIRDFTGICIKMLSIPFALPG